MAGQSAHACPAPENSTNKQLQFKISAQGRVLEVSIEEWESGRTRGMEGGRERRPQPQGGSVESLSRHLHHGLSTPATGELQGHHEPRPRMGAAWSMQGSSASQELAKMPERGLGTEPLLRTPRWLRDSLFRKWESGISIPEERNARKEQAQESSQTHWESTDAGDKGSKSQTSPLQRATNMNDKRC